MNVGGSNFFHLLSFILFLFCSYIFGLSLDWATVLAKILFISCWNYTSPCRLFIFWYLFVNYSTFFQTWIKRFLYWFQPWLFLFCSYFPVNLIVLLKLLLKKRVYCLLFVIFHQYICVFVLVPSFDIY